MTVQISTRAILKWRWNPCRHGSLWREVDGAKKKNNKKKKSNKKTNSTKRREDGQCGRTLLEAVHLWSQGDLLQSLSHISLWLPWFIRALSVLRQGHCKRHRINLQWNPLLALEESWSAFKSVWLDVDQPLWWRLRFVCAYIALSVKLHYWTTCNVQNVGTQLLHKTTICFNGELWAPREEERCGGKKGIIQKKPEVFFSWGQRLQMSLAVQVY